MSVPKIKVGQAGKQILGLSAVLGNLNGFDSWLGTELVFSRERPVELRQGAVLSSGDFQWRSWNTKEQGVEKFGEGNLFPLVRKLVQGGEQVVIIRNSVSQAQETATVLADVLSHLPAAHSCIQALSLELETETRDLLVSTLRHATAFHHADCELAERRIVEDGFRKGEVRVIASTTTLSMGVNLPCRTIVLADNKKWSSVRGSLQQVNWLVGEVRNILGRAGRLGLEGEFGRGMLLATTVAEMRQIESAYLTAELEPLVSTFEEVDIALRVLDVICTGFASTESEVLDFLFHTFAAMHWKSEEARSQISRFVADALKTLRDSGLCKEGQRGKILATDLGKICIAKGASLDSFIQLADAISIMTEFNALDVLLAVTAPDEVSGHFYRGVRWTNRDRLERVYNRLKELTQHEHGSVLLEQKLTESSSRIQEDDAIRFSAVALAYDVLYSNQGTADLRKAYMLPSACIRNLCINLSWMLDIASGIAQVTSPKIAGDLSTFADCIGQRSPLASRYLNGLEGNLGRDEKIRLVAAGFASADDFLGKVGSDFKGIVNPAKADRIIAGINKKRLRKHEFWRRDHLRRLDAIGRAPKTLEAIYTASGTELETAVVELFQSGFSSSGVHRITDQHKGEPDLIMTFKSGESMTIQVTAKDDPSKYIESKKAGDIVSQSARFHPNAYMCLGRPDFQDLAIEQASHLMVDMNFKLMPMYALGELYVLQCEGKLSPEQVGKFLLDQRGYINAGIVGEAAKPKS